MSIDEVQYVESQRGSDKSLSRYITTKILVNKDGKTIQECWLKKEWDEEDDDVFYQVGPETEFRPDLIAEEVYGTPWLYWIVAFANGMVDAFAETYIGRKLRMPSYQRAYAEIVGK